MKKAVIAAHKAMKPTKKQLQEAVHGTLIDLLPPLPTPSSSSLVSSASSSSSNSSNGNPTATRLRLLLAGINPGLYSTATQTHFGRPGNKFWPSLHRSGLTPIQYHPWEEKNLLPLGMIHTLLFMFDMTNT
jgi:hypothetical protein